MDDLEAKVRCLEVAERLARAKGITDAEGVVNIQTALYSALTREPPADKPVKGPGRKAAT